MRKYINEVLLDQLPVLSHLQRYMDELTIMEAPPAANGAGSRFVLEQLATVRDELMRTSNFAELVSGTELGYAWQWQWHGT